MSNEITKNVDLGSFDEIEYVIQRITEEGTQKYDIEKHCLNNKNFFRIPTSGILALLIGIGFINRQENTLHLQEKGKRFLSSTNRKQCFVVAIFKTLVNNEEYSDFLLKEKVKYDTYFGKYAINYSSIDLKYSGLRNLLENLGYFYVDSRNKSILLIDDDLFKLTHDLITEIVKKKTIEELKEDLKRKEKNGLIAEEFVVSYEQKRIAKKADSIKRISDIDTTAGFDILSYDQDSSLIHDRYIEVKSYVNRPYFFLTRNEFETANRFRSKYYLYLVDRSQIDMPDYHPIIIPNPYDSVFTEPEDWTKSCEQWYFTKKSFDLEKTLM